MNTLDALNELVARSARPRTAQQEEWLRLSREHASAHPELIDQLVSEVDLRLAANGAASFRPAWEQVRWNTRRHLTNAFLPVYARVAVFRYPRLNSRVQFVASALTDGALGTWIATRKLPGEYAARLQWADELEAVQSEPPAQGARFDEVA